MVVPSERRIPLSNLDVGDRTARHYVRQAGMSLGPDGRVGLNPLYEKAREAIAPKLVQIGNLFRRLRRP